MDQERLEAQLRFIVEVDRLKQVLRRTPVSDNSRRENSAEHCWHVALMALVLAEWAGEPDVDRARVAAMVLVHDLVEIDAGDTFLYDEEGRRGQAGRERRAADRLFALLPSGQAAQVRALWEEFERRDTPEARFAAALDRLQPLLMNYETEGAAWQRHRVRMSEVVERNRPVLEAAPALWQHARALIEESVERGYLAPG
jgi:putative hydrolase of HD superfamily